MSAETPGMAVEPPIVRRRRGFRSRAWRGLKKAPPTAWFGLVVVFLYVFVAVFAPWIAPFPESEATGAAFEPWSSEHLLGTDQLGRDMLTRM
ncbi:MAG: D,D-dipeptide ABC transporter permease, partial [Dongiaceae bacterium]